MVVMRLQRVLVAIAYGVMALTTGACSSGTAVAPTTSIGIGIGEVCGVTALAGGAASAVGVKNRALLHVCTSGPQEAIRGLEFSIMASNGTRYKARIYSDRGWTAGAPAGTRFA